MTPIVIRCRLDALTAPTAGYVAGFIRGSRTSTVSTTAAAILRAATTFARGISKLSLTAIVKSTDLI